VLALTGNDTSGSWAGYKDPRVVVSGTVCISSLSTALRVARSDWHDLLPLAVCFGRIIWQLLLSSVIWIQAGLRGMKLQAHLGLRCKTALLFFHTCTVTPGA
jgi:hypothetical protein